MPVHPHVIPFSGIRLRLESRHSYDETLKRLLDDIGHKPVAINKLANDHLSWADYQAAVQPFVGPSGFMLFSQLDHGAWIQKAGLHTRLVRIILGNPLIAITMLRHDLTAGLFAPVELLLTEESGGRCSLLYVKPSSLMVIDDNPPLLDAATALDDKLDALTRKVAYD